MGTAVEQRPSLAIGSKVLRVQVSHDTGSSTPSTDYYRRLPVLDPDRFAGGSPTMKALRVEGSDGGSIEALAHTADIIIPLFEVSQRVKGSDGGLDYPKVVAQATKETPHVDTSQTTDEPVDLQANTSPGKRVRRVVKTIATFGAAVALPLSAATACANRPYYPGEAIGFQYPCEWTRTKAVPIRSTFYLISVPYADSTGETRRRETRIAYPGKYCVDKFNRPVDKWGIPAIDLSKPGASAGGAFGK